MRSRRFTTESIFPPNSGFGSAGHLQHWNHDL
jgi:hypothetical protein